jgi:hypothetical protein
MSKDTIQNSLLLTDVYKIITKRHLSPRDHITVVSRGVDTNFWTTELPALGKAVEASLCTLQLDIADVRFKCKKGSKLPLFMYDLFSVIYDDDGVLVNPDASIIQLIRQFTLLFYKFVVPFPKAALKAADEKFRLTDSLVKTSYTDEQIDRIRPYFLDLLPPIGDLIPSDGPGAVTEGYSNLAKLGDHSFCDSLLQEHLPFNPVALRYQNREHFRLNRDAIVKGCELSRVTHIPKDARGPRTICIQPRSLMSYQRPLMQKLYDYIESEGAPGQVNFTDQTINQRLAQLGSLDQSYATIDLKDASDLVSWELVKTLVNDQWYNALLATRSPGVIFDDGTTMSINKFAPMGSALCFPIEAMLFYAICRSVVDEVYVYGDDIIVPKTGYSDVCLALEEYGLIVNRSKSFNTGYFRESCGGDYYAGHPINIVRLKESKPLSFIAFANNIAQSVLGTEIADCIIDLYTSYTGMIIEQRPLSESGLHHNMVYYTDKIDYTIKSGFKCRWNDSFQIYEKRVLKEISLPNVLMPDVSDDDLYYHSLRQSKRKSDSLSFKGITPRLVDWYGNISEELVESTNYIKYGWVRL